LKALITGITGQDGSYLAELLFSNGYEVHGIVRHVASEYSTDRFRRLRYILPHIKLHYASLENYGSIYKVIQDVKPDELYHLAAQSYVGYSFDDELSTMGININGTHYVLNCLREIKPDCKFFFAGSSEMFGKVEEIPQKETTPFHPRSSYGISKVAGYDLTRLYREAYGMYCCSGITFNHESPRRGYEFVTRKISLGVASIVKRKSNQLLLGNLDAKRDWGYARDYVEAFWLMLQKDFPKDYVIGTGETHSVMEFVEKAFDYVGLPWQKYTVIDKNLLRKSEVDLLLSDPSLIKKELGWYPKTSFTDLVAMMVEGDLNNANV